MESFDSKQQFKTEYTNWMQEFVRLDLLLREADRRRIKLNDIDFTSDEPRSFYAVLDPIFVFIKPYLYDSKKAEMILKRKEIEKSLMDYESDPRLRSGQSAIPVALIKALKDFHEELMELKQLIGLGIPARKKMSSGQKLKNAME